MGLGKLVLRAALGGYFFGHGMQKLAGWFGGGGPEGTGEMFEQAGLRPGRESALLAGAAEAGGGSLLALGLFTPAAWRPAPPEPSTSPSAGKSSSRRSTPTRR